MTQKMTGSEFYTWSRENTPLTKQEFDRKWVVLRCHCGEPNCYGWVLTTRDMPMPAPDRGFKYRGDT